MPYCDSTKSDEERVASILKGLSLADKIALGSPTHKPFCECHTAPVASQSLPDYKWLTETNSCVNSNCKPHTILADVWAAFFQECQQ